MKKLQPLKERIKTNLKKAFLDIKSQINEERLYIFALGRVEDIEGQYFCTASTLKELKTNFENDSTYYSTFWDASELELSADYNDINYDELNTYLDNATEEEYDQLREEYDQILIDSLTELKKRRII